LTDRLTAQLSAGNLNENGLVQL